MLFVVFIVVVICFGVVWLIIYLPSNYSHAKEMFAANSIGSEQDRFKALCKMLENSVGDFTGSATLIDEHNSCFTVTA